MSFLNPDQNHDDYIGVKGIGELMIRMMIVMMVTIMIIMSCGVKGIGMIDDHLQRMRRFSTSATSIRTKWVNFRNLQFRR